MIYFQSFENDYCRNIPQIFSSQSRKAAINSALPAPCTVSDRLASDDSRIGITTTVENNSKNLAHESSLPRYTNRTMSNKRSSITIHGRKVEVKLPCVFRLELAGLQLDHHIAAEVEVIEQQVDVEVIAAYVEVVLVAEERKAGSQLQQELCHILDQCLFDVTLYHVLFEWDKIKDIRIFHRLGREFTLRRR